MEGAMHFNYNHLFISSTDTLCGLPIDQKLPGGWNDRPPLFGMEGEETDDLLKAMIRQGIPPALRCADSFRALRFMFRIT